ncbi:hypothetical protein HYV57_05760 [Candidatus Peregrinibacteria bacterium]|nr:hypothetical protein [Candidatus Peregrinibacteria bacterium]
MSVNGQTHSAFSANTLNISSPKNNFEKEIIEHSRKTYSKPKDEVENILQQWDEAGSSVHGSNREYESDREHKAVKAISHESDILNQKFRKPLIVR